MKQSIANGLLDVQLMFISDEVWFTLCWNAYNQNKRYWCSENLIQLMKFLA
jgi:hypothetical protein